MAKSIKAMSEGAENVSSRATEEMGNEIASPWMHATLDFAQVTSAWSDELVRFGGKRLSRNRDAVDQLSKCSTWQDILKLQMTWAEEALRDYLDESREIFGIVQRATDGQHSSSDLTAKEGQMEGHRHAA